MNYKKLFSIVLVTIGFALNAHAQATRTWVSGVGDDVNPCSRTAPCKTFAGAISKTAAGGEISVLDPGGYGAVTITKAMTIDGDGTLASILNSGTSGVIVNAGPNDVVTLRSISINGGGTGQHGVRYLAGARLIVENVTIGGMASGFNGIEAALTTNGTIVANNVSITGGSNGVRTNTSVGVINASLNNVSIRGAVNGVDVLSGSVEISDSTIAQSSGFGVLAEGGAANVLNSRLVNNNVAAQAQTGASVRLSNNDVFDNATGFGCGGGTLASANNNRKAGNTGGTAPTCSPTLTITLQ